MRRFSKTGIVVQKSVVANKAKTHTSIMSACRWRSLYRFLVITLAVTMVFRASFGPPSIDVPSPVSKHTKQEKKDNANNFTIDRDRITTTGNHQDAAAVTAAPATRNSTAAATIAAFTADDIDWSDSIFRRNGWDIDPVVIESHKLLFFTVPKNSCSEFKMLFRRMMGFKDWKTVGSMEDRLHNPATNGLKYLGSYPKEQQAEFMTSPEWTRAIFLRDPRERVLSAYMDKGLTKYKQYKFVAGGYVKSHCCGMKVGLKTEKDLSKERARIERSNPHCLPIFPFEESNTPENFPFEDFVRNFMRQCPDAHWALQSKRMTESSWKMINFVGHLRTFQQDGHALLNRIGAFEEFGLEGWGPHNGKIFETNFVKHATSAKNKTNTFYHSNFSEVETLVLQHYRKDYEHPIMNMMKPESWERLMGK